MNSWNLIGCYAQHHISVQYLRLYNTMKSKATTVITCSYMYCCSQILDAATNSNANPVASYEDGQIDAKCAQQNSVRCIVNSHEIQMLVKAQSSESTDDSYLSQAVIWFLLCWICSSKKDKDNCQLYFLTPSQAISYKRCKQNCFCCVYI